MSWKPADGDRRCVHKANRSGGQCKLWGVVGTEPPTCKVHGGSAPQVKAKAEQRVLARKATEIARRMDADVPAHGGDPMSALDALLERDAAMVAKYEAATAEHPDPSDRLAQAVHAGYRAERDAASRRIDLLVRSGIAGELLRMRQQAQAKDVQATYGRMTAIVAAAAHRALVTALLGRADRGVIPLAEVEPIAADALKGIQAEFQAIQQSGTIKGEVVNSD